MAASSSTGHGNSSRSSHSDAGGTDDVLGERVHPLLQLDLVGPEVEAGRGRLVLRLVLRLGGVAHAARLPTGHPAVTSKVQLPTFSPPTYHATRCLPVFAVAIVTNFFTPLGAGWALAHSRFFLPGNFTQTL